MAAFGGYAGSESSEAFRFGGRGLWLCSKRICDEYQSSHWIGVQCFVDALTLNLYICAHLQ